MRSAGDVRSPAQVPGLLVLWFAESRRPQPLVKRPLPGEWDAESRPREGPSELPTHRRSALAFRCGLFYNRSEEGAGTLGFLGEVIVLIDRELL